MLDRLIDRLPALLLLAVVLLAAQVAISEKGEALRLVPALPALGLLLLYFIKGRSGGKGKSGGKGGSKSAASARSASGDEA
ncbi:MAG: hypothetical protein ACT4PU_13100 [Planctomycetota bacterium]